MRCSDDHGPIDNVPVQAISPREIAPLLTFVILIVVVVGLDDADIQVVGCFLYPIERLLNVAFFPNAATVVRGNGTALLVLIPTLLLAGAGLYAVTRIARALRRFGMWFAGRCR